MRNTTNFWGYAGQPSLPVVRGSDIRNRNVFVFINRHISSLLNRTEDLLVVRNEISSSYYYFFSCFLSQRFLRDDWMDLLEIFREDVTLEDADRF